MATKAKNSRNIQNPENAINCETYAELRADLAAFDDNRGYDRFVMVLGPPGTGKSQATRRLYNAIEIKGDLTAWQLYQTIYEYNGCTLVFTDLPPRFYSDPKRLSILKHLTDSDPIRTISWGCESSCLAAGVPSSFQVTCKVLILANTWKSLTDDVKALESRSQATIIFRPTVYEVHKEVAAGGWYEDQVVYDYLYDLISHQPIASPSLRLYQMASEQRIARPDVWKTRVLGWAYNNDERLRQIAELFADETLTSNHRKATEFVRRGYGSRATLYNLLAEFPNWKKASHKGPNFRLKPKKTSDEDYSNEYGNEPEEATVSSAAKGLLVSP